MATSFATNVDSCDELLRAVASQVALIKRAPTNKDGVRVANGEASRALRELDRLTATLAGQARNAAPSQRRTMLESLERIKAEVSKARADLQTANDAANRAELIGTAGGASSKGPSKAELDARDRAIRTTESAVRGTAKLEAARAQLHETEDIGINVVDTLEQQRDVILRTRDKAEDVNTLTDKARGIVRGIQRRTITNKFILGKSTSGNLLLNTTRSCPLILASSPFSLISAGFAILLILAMIGIVVYFGYIKNPRPSGT
jgi:vesicle transport through interaction with t-SNAREs 1